MSEVNAQEVVSIIHTKGTLDLTYSTLILASTAAAMGKRVEVFCTLYGAKCLYKDLSNLKVSPVGNPAMILKLPFGPSWLQKIDLNAVLPQFIWMLPGMTGLVTAGFKRQMKKQNQLPIEELRSLCMELGVKFTLCSMAMESFGMVKEELIENVEVAGAATYFAMSSPSQSLFV